MLNKSISVSKTARYFILGEPGDQITHVWFVCHGYGQLASDFLKTFEVLNNGKNLIIAPEGLHRFYVKAFTGKIGASWMTKEDRNNDIKDYINYLDELYDEILMDFKGRNPHINVLGFSQGTATVCRWLCNGRSKADNLILWAGVFPPDLNFSAPSKGGSASGGEAGNTILNSMNIRILIGDKDEFIEFVNIEEHEKLLQQNNIDYELIRYKGTHKIDVHILKELAGKLQTIV
ncbi:hypothetical protein JYU16_01255 [bacterium AH-315-M05]|nr:hypothetical protein [bacterium AH-315-M05]